MTSRRQSQRTSTTTSLIVSGKRFCTLHVVEPASFSTTRCMWDEGLLGIVRPLTTLNCPLPLDRGHDAMTETRSTKGAHEYSSSTHKSSSISFVINMQGKDPNGYFILHSIHFVFTRMWAKALGLIRALILIEFHGLKFFISKINITHVVFYCWFIYSLRPACPSWSRLRMGPSCRRAAASAIAFSCVNFY